MPDGAGFYFGKPVRSCCAAAWCLTWHMAGERRSFRLSLSVRWSIPVPIVSPVHSLKTNPRGQTKLRRLCRSRLETCLDLRLYPHLSLRKRGHASPYLSFNSVEMCSRWRRRLWMNRADKTAVVFSSWRGDGPEEEEDLLVNRDTEIRFLWLATPHNNPTTHLLTTFFSWIKPRIQRTSGITVGGLCEGCSEDVGATSSLLPLRAEELV